MLFISLNMIWTQHASSFIITTIVFSPVIGWTGIQWDLISSTVDLIQPHPARDFDEVIADHGPPTTEADLTADDLGIKVIPTIVAHSAPFPAMIDLH